MRAQPTARRANTAAGNAAVVRLSGQRLGEFGQPPSTGRAEPHTRASRQRVGPEPRCPRIGLWIIAQTVQQDGIRGRSPCA